MKLYKEASLMMLPTSVKDGKLYSIFPQPKPLSGELVTNGGFDTDSDWSKGTGCTISDGKAKFTSAASGQGFTQSNFLTIGKIYKVAFTVSNYSEGSVKVRYPFNMANTITANGSYVEYGEATTDDLFFQNVGTTTLSIDSVSVVEVDQLPADFDFSRGSNLAATRINEQGLIEKGRENLLLHSNQFDTTWGDDGGTITNGFEGYDGTNDAWKYTKQGQFDGINQSVSVSGVHTVSLYVKLPDGETDVDSVLFRLDYSGGHTSVVFALGDDSVPSVSGNGINAEKENIGNGWYRCSFTLNQSTTRVSFRPSLGGNTGGTSGSIFIQDTQLEAGLVATDYIESGATTGKAGVLEDLPRLDWSGSCPTLLLEPQRTNLVEYSEYGGGFSVIDSNITKTDNATTSPEGIDNAVKLEGITGSSGNQAVIFGGLSNTSVVDRTFTASVYIKPVNAGDVGQDITLSIQRQTGDFEALIVVTEIDSADWKRYDLTYTFTGAGAGDQVGCVLKILRQDSTIDDVYVYGAQLEEGSYATSYIPTRGTSVTRAKDIASSLDFSGFTTGEDFTMFVELADNEELVRDNSSNNIRLSDAGGSNLGSIRIYKSDSNATRHRVVFQDNTGDFSPPSVLLDSTNPKVAIKRTFATGEFKVFVDGVLRSTGTNTDFLAFEDILLEGGGSPINVKELTLFDKALSDNECINLTSL